MGIRRSIVLALLVLAVAACSMGTDHRRAIEGNNTGGLIPNPVAQGSDPQAQANAHCAKYKSNARITYNGVSAGGDVVFVCETAEGSGVFSTAPPDGPAAKPVAQGTTQAPVARPAPVTR